jgi:hypothetical protein
MSRFNVINEKFVVVLTGIVAVVASYISYTTGIMTSYNDATAHLNTARRMFDSLTPGFVQIGSVWLPLLHILELPFVLNDYLFHTGLAGAIVSGLSFVAASYFLYKLAMMITHQRPASLIGVLLFITNGNLLYLQSTAMFEPLLMATVFGASYFLAKWTQTNLINHLVIAALFTCLATLTRYDGWAFLIATIFYVGVISLLIHRTSREGPLIIYTLLASFGIGLWLLYNLMIFGDPLFFANSEFSAKAQQDILFQRGSLPTRHDFPLSIQTYSLAVLVNLGVVSVGLFILGLLIFTFQNILRPRNWGPFLLLIPYFFNVVSLYFGQSVIWMPMVPPYFDTYFNARYGVLMLPAAAFFVGYLAGKHWILKIIIPLFIALQFFLFLNPEHLPIFGQKVGIITRQDTVSSLNEQTIKLSDFLYQNHDGGLILISSASVDSLIFRSRLPLKTFITEGTGNYWHESLKDPTRHATWIVFFRDKTDRVGKVVSKNPDLEKYYKKVYEDPTYLVYKKK